MSTKPGPWANKDREISEGDSSVLVTDTGTGQIDMVVDGSTVQSWTAAGAEFPEGVGVDTIQFDTSFSNGTSVGRLQWNSDDGTLEFGLPGGTVNLQIGQEHVILCKNVSGEIIPNGTPVYIFSTDRTLPQIKPADSDTIDAIPESVVVGVTTEQFGINATGYITSEGLVRDFDTDHLVEGDPIWLSTTSGEMTSVIPTAPNHKIFIGHCIKADPSSGLILVHIIPVPTTMGLSDVLAAAPADNDLLSWNAANSRWELIGGTLQIGEDDVTPGRINISGGNNDEAALYFYNNDSYDSVVEYYRMRTSESYFQFGPDTNLTAFEWRGNDDTLKIAPVGLVTFSGAGGVNITTGLNRLQSGELYLGADDATAGKVTLFTSVNSPLDALIMEEDQARDSWIVHTGNTTNPQLSFIDSAGPAELACEAQGGFFIGRNKTLQGMLTLWGNATTGGPYIQLSNADNEDSQVIQYKIDCAGGDLHIGPNTDYDALKWDAANARWDFTAANATQFSGAGGIVVGAATISFSSDDLIVKNTDADGLIYLRGDSEGEKTMASFTPAGAATLMYGGSGRISTTATGISITDGTATAATIQFSSDDLVISNNDGGGHIYFKVYDGEGTNSGIDIIRGGAVNLYYNNQKKFETTDTGVSVTGAMAIGAATYTATGVTAAEFTVAGKLFVDDGSSSQWMEIGANDLRRGTLDIFGGASSDEGGTLKLYNSAAYEGTVDLYQFRAYIGDLWIGPSTETQALVYSATTERWEFRSDNPVLFEHEIIVNGAITIDDGTAANKVKITHDSGHVYFRNYYDGGDIHFQGEVAEDTLKEMILAAPDGAVSLSYNGAVKLATTASGIQLDDGSAGMTIQGSGGNWTLNCTNNRDFYITEGGANMARFLNAGAVELYYSTNLKIATTVTGIEVTGTAVADDPTDSTHLATKNYVDNAIGVEFDFFYSGVAHAIGGIYYTAPTLPTGLPNDDLTTAALGEADDQALVNFATDANGVGITSLTAGVYAIHIHAERTVGNRDTQIYVELYSRTSGGAETLRATSEISDLITSAGAVELHASVADDVDLNATDLLVWKFYANCGAGAATTLVLSVEGVTSAHATIPSTTEILSASYLRKTWNTGLANLTEDGKIYQSETVDQNTRGVGGLLVLSADGNWDDADRSAVGTVGLLAIAVDAGAAAGKRLLTEGLFRDDTWDWTPGEKLFVGDDGEITDAAGIAGYGVGDFVQVIGYAKTADVIHFNPESDYLAL